MRAKPLFFPLLLAVVLAALAPGGIQAAHADELYYRIHGEGNTTMLGSDTVMVDTGYDLVQGYSATVLLKAKATHNVLVYDFSGAGIRVGDLEVGIKANHEWYTYINVYVVVTSNGETILKKWVGQVKPGESKGWSLTIYLERGCSVAVDIRIEDEYHTLWTGSARLNGSADIYATPWDSGSRTGVLIQHVEQTADCGPSTGTPPVTGTVSKPWPTGNDVPGILKPLRDVRFAAGLGIVLVALGLMLGFARR